MFVSSLTAGRKTIIAEGEASEVLRGYRSEVEQTNAGGRRLRGYVVLLHGPTGTRMDKK